MNRSDLLAKLERDRPDCPVCTKPVIPSRQAVRILTFPTENEEIISRRLNEVRVALLPVHDDCLGEAVERIRRAQERIRDRAIVADLEVDPTLADLGAG